MATGTVKFFDTYKGFGFISPDKGGSDLYVDIGSVKHSGLSTLTNKQKVSFKANADSLGEGNRAVNLRLL